jgi:two-component system response regulator YesN
MIGLLLVEDEAPIKQKLMHNAPWAEHGFTVYGASNGVEALEVLAQHSIAIMVTDIQMPKMNGIELIRAVKKNFDMVKIIVISGFAEFEYAQESIRLNVSDYLLKPFATRKLLNAVLRLQKELELEASKEKELGHLREQLLQNMAALREKFFIDIFNRNVGEPDIRAQLEFLGMAELIDHPFQVAVLDLLEQQPENSSEETKYLTNLQFLQLVQRLLAGSDYQHFVINHHRNQMVLIMIDPDPELAMRLSEILAKVRLILNHSLACGIGHSYVEWPDLAVSYQEACSALQYRYLYGLNQVFFINDLNLDNPSYHKIFHFLHHHPIFEDLKIGADHAIQTDLKSIIREMRESRISPELSKMVACNLVLLVCTTLNELGYASTEIFGSDDSALPDFDQVDSLDEMEQRLFVFFETINSFISKKRSSLNHQLVEEIRQYIDANYSGDITLSGMAIQYKISPSYLSLLFTEQIGKNFIDYLTEHRITKARELLKHTDMKIYEISNVVGYNDSFYFSNCFKKLVGVSPSEYRESRRASTEP